MKFVFLLLPFLIACLPQSPKDTPVPEEPPVIDPLAVQAWHLENTGQHAYSEGFALKGQDHKIKATHEQLNLTGKNIRIAVSDDALEVTHPDLEQNQLVGEHRDYTSSAPFVGDPGPQNFMDAHGTAVTGLIAAVKGNTIGSFGVAPDASFAGFNYLSSDFDNSIILHQTQGDFHIFNYSYGTLGYVITDSYSTDFENALKVGVNNGSVYVKAAGNSYRETYTISDSNYTSFGNANFEAEQTLPYYIVVGAINSRGQRASYSTPGANLWISGAGGEFGTSAPAMITTDLSGCSFGYAHSTYGSTPFDKGVDENNPHCDFLNSMNGTSSATPVISGIVALMLEANPNLTWRDIKHILAKTADRVDYAIDNNTLNHPANLPGPSGHIYDYKWIENGAGNFFSNWYGFGRANALAASMMALTYTPSLGTYIEGSFISSPAVDLPIPSTQAGITHTINVTSTVTKIESVQVEVTVDHPFIGDLGIELTSPSGTVSKLLLINNRGLDQDPSNSRKIQLLSNAFYEEAASGNWTIKVVDGDAIDQGDLKSWAIKINGH